MRKAENVIAGCVKDGRLDIMNLCEFGAHQQGPKAAGIDVRDMNIFQGPAPPSVRVFHNYLTAWNFDADTTQFGVRAASDSLTFRLTSDICEPELVVQLFDHGTGVRLVQGNLHIRIPTKKDVTIPSRQRMVREALDILQSQAPSDSAAQPVVLVLLGDCNLTKDLAESAIQPMQTEVDHWRTVWHAHATSFGKSGDVMIVKGAHAMSFDLPFGCSHIQKGITVKVKSHSIKS